MLAPLPSRLPLSGPVPTATSLSACAPAADRLPAEPIHGDAEPGIHVRLLGGSGRLGVRPGRACRQEPGHQRDDEAPNDPSQ